MNIIQQIVVRDEGKGRAVRVRRVRDMVAAQCPAPEDQQAFQDVLELRDRKGTLMILLAEGGHLPVEARTIFEWAWYEHSEILLGVTTNRAHFEWARGYEEIQFNPAWAAFEIPEQHKAFFEERAAEVDEYLAEMEEERQWD